MEKKKDIPHTKFRSFQKGSGSRQVGEMSNSFPPAPQNSRDESWARQWKLGMVYFFFNNAPLQVPSCPLAGKALQLSLSLFPYFWAGLFSTLIHQGSLLGRTGLGITQCKVGLWLYPLFRVMSCVCSLAFWNLSSLIPKKNNRMIKWYSLSWEPLPGTGMRLAFIKDDDDNHNPARQQFPIFFGLLPLRNYFEN